MNDEQYLLANAYLDGDVTADERRIAEADPDVMSEVESLRALQAELRETPEASPEAREAAIAAAMNAFHARAAVDTTESAPEEPSAATPAVVPFRPRPAYAKYLAVAAALVAVAGLGIVVSQAGGGDDDAGGGGDQASVADTALAETSARDENLTTIAGDGSAEATAEQAGEAGSAEPAAEADDDAAEAADDAAEAEMAEEAVEETAEEAGESAPALDAGPVTRVEVPPDFDPDDPLLNEVALAFYGAYLLERSELRELGPTPETTCSGRYEILGTAVYVLGGSERQVYVAVNADEGSVFALDIDTCIELANGSLF